MRDRYHTFVDRATIFKLWRIQQPLSMCRENFIELCPPYSIVVS